MRQRYILATLFITAMGGMAAAAYAAEPPAAPDRQNPAIAETAPPAPADMPAFGCPRPGPHPHGPMMAFGADMPMPHMPPGGFPRGDNPALELAGKLSAMETLIGIRSAQLDAWRDYTNALTDLLAMPRHQPPGPPVGDDARPSQTAQDAGKPTELFGERIADRVLDRAAKATVLKDKAVALRNVLTSDQLAKLEDAERSLVPGPHPFR